MVIFLSGNYQENKQTGIYQENNKPKLTGILKNRNLAWKEKGGTFIRKLTRFFNLSGVG